MSKLVQEVVVSTVTELATATHSLRQQGWVIADIREFEHLGTNYLVAILHPEREEL